MKNLRKMTYKSKKLIGLFIVVVIFISTAFQSKFFEIAKQIDIYTSIFKELNMHYVDEINPAELNKKAVNQMMQSLDPYTVFYDEQGIEDARIAASGQYGGIGVSTELLNNKLIITEISKDSPAQLQGLKIGDQILSIEGIDVSDSNQESVISLLNGLPNTTVSITIKRQQKSQIIEVKREKIEDKAVPYYSLLNENIGYIAFTKFNDKAAKEVKEAFIDLKEQGMQYLLIDVRNNPGGLLNEAVNIANFFLPKGKVIVTTKAKTEGWSDTFSTKFEPLDETIPIVVLINEKSASASEILAGSLQDYDRAVIVGKRSFGKGLVQRFRELPYGTQMKLTISKYYTPSGRCIQELDYTNKKEDGSVPKFSDYGRETYSTENGRIVYGGGGILPDIEIDKKPLTKVSEQLLSSEVFFSYITSFMNSHNSIKSPKEFYISENDFQNFLKFTAENNNLFITDTEQLLQDSKQEGDKQLLLQNKSLFEQLLSEIIIEKGNEIRKDKEQLSQKLSQEIVRGYYYSEGVFEHKIEFDEEISQAKQILTSPNRYSKILQN